MSKSAYLISVGKLKDKNLRKIEDEYLKRLITPKLIIEEVKANSENRDIEGNLVIQKIKTISKNTTPYVILLKEKTNNNLSLDSLSFSKWLYNLFDTTPNTIIFIIGGACGHSKEVEKIASNELSLSPLTFPHQLARILFVEQYYRAQTIYNKHPYHN